MVDHAANAQRAGLTIGRKATVIFGPGNGGTPLMQAHQTLGLDFPLSTLIYNTAKGEVGIAYRETRDILAGQGVATDAFSPVGGMSAMLAEVSTEAAGGKNGLL